MHSHVLVSVRVVAPTTPRVHAQLWSMELSARPQALVWLLSMWKTLPSSVWIHVALLTQHQVFGELEQNTWLSLIFSILCPVEEVVGMAFVPSGVVGRVFQSFLLFCSTVQCPGAALGC